MPISCLGIYLKHIKRAAHSHHTFYEDNHELVYNNYTFRMYALLIIWQHPSKQHPMEPSS